MGFKLDLDRLDRVDAEPEPLPHRAPAGPPKVERAWRGRMVGWVARTVNAMSKARGGGGSVIGGKVAMQFSRHPLRVLGRGRWIAAVSGTNGKTTTTHLLAAALATRGPVVTNKEGSNLRSGLTAALASDLGPDIAVLEVDEATLPRVADDLSPDLACLLNLSRDQLDRYGEVRIVAGRWRTSFYESDQTHVVANCDDPLVAWAGLGAKSTTWVSVGQRWVNDATVCPACGGRIERTGDGPHAHWSCSRCDLARPSPDLVLDGDELVARNGERGRIELHLPGRFNLANAAMAAAAARDAGVRLAEALAAMAHTRSVAGRYRQVIVDGHRVRLLMAKNPAGWQEALDILAPPPTPVVAAINARVADGHDPSWLWDVPFERLAGRTVVAAGDRALDLAVRLRYAGVDHRVHRGPVLEAVSELDGEDADVIGNYTVFSDVLQALPPEAAPMAAV